MAAAAAAPSDVYWVGADNNVYLKSASGVQNLGSVVGGLGSAGNYNLSPSGFESNTLGQSIQAQQIADPNPPAPAVPGADAGSSSTIIPGVNDPATIAGYGQAITDTQQSINELPTQLQGSENQIADAYNTAYQTLLGQGNEAASTYGANTTANQQGYVTNKNTIGTNAGQSLNGLERLLGSRGAGGSSAATIAAPQAVAEEATQQRAGAGQAYGATQNGLDTSYGQYKIQNANDIASIGKQEQDQNNAAVAAMNSTKAGLLQQLATLSAQKAAAQGGNPTAAAQPFLTQAANYLSSAATLGLNVAPLNYNTTAYTAPAATSYTTNPFATPSTSNPNAGITASTTAPALTPLLKATTALSGVPNTSAAPATPVAGS